MGVDLAGLVTYQTTTLGSLRGKTIAIDAYNALYQFLSIIRQPDGTPLMDRQGRVTSHLSGLMYRNANLLQSGILPVYVFDGEPHPLKMRVLEGRAEVRSQAEKEWKEAIEAGDLERAMTKAQQTSRLTGEMVESSKRLLQLLGIPIVGARRDGEAQASYMTLKGDVWCTASQDYDSLLYGCPRLLKNLTLSGRRKLPRRQEWVEVNIELIDLRENLARLGINREQLVDIGILIGTDFNEGIRGIGPKKALTLIHDHGDLEAVAESESLLLEEVEEIRRIFLEPRVTDNYSLEWSPPDQEGVVACLCGEYDFSEDRVVTALKKIREGERARAQSQLDHWF